MRISRLLLLFTCFSSLPNSNYHVKKTLYASVLALPLILKKSMTLFALPP
jgi:hypothetical protein